MWPEAGERSWLEKVILEQSIVELEELG